MLPGDSERAAELASGPIDDTRAQHFWDPQKHLAREMGAALGIRAAESIPMSGGAGAAWDVYLAFGGGDADLRGPRFWMHQIGVKHAPRLDVEGWIRGIKGLLG